MWPENHDSPNTKFPSVFCCDSSLAVQQAFWADLEGEKSISFVNKIMEVVENIYLATCVFEFLLVMNSFVEDLHAINQKNKPIEI